MKGLKLLILLMALGFVTMAQSKIEFEPYLFVSQKGDSVEAELGTFQVPENRNNENSRVINIKFVRFKSTAENPGYPTIYLAGGPGGSGIGAAKGRRFELFMQMRKYGDVIAYDQRGTGMSNDIPRCSSMARIDLMEPGTQDLYVSKLAETAKTCWEFWESEGYDITGYNTVENAADIDELRRGLGVKKVNLWGISYGTHLAFQYVKAFEKNVDRMVLASLEGPNHTIKLPENTQQYLNTVQGFINKSPETTKAYPDLIGTMQQVMDQLEKEPITSSYQDPRSGSTGDVVISKLDLQLVTSFFLTKNPEDVAKLPYVYYQMTQGDFTGVSTQVAMIKSFMGMIRPMSFAMDAMSGISQERKQRVLEQAETSILGRTTNFPFPDVSEKVGFPVLTGDFRLNPKSGVSALFFSGTLDGRTYLPAAKELTAGFKNGTHIVLDGAGHDLFFSTPKVSELIHDFMRGKNIQPQTISVGAPDFVLPE